LLSYSASAASFDCRHATAPREHIICADPKLSDLDGRLGHLFGERRAALSATGAALLVESQRSWLHFIAQVCPVLKLMAPPDAEPTKCLTNEYTIRLDELSKVGVRIGPYMFNRVDLYAAKPAPDRDTGVNPGSYIQHVAFPQIDSPLNQESEAWNKHAKRSLPVEGYCESDGDNEVSYDLGYATDRMISLLWTESSYCHGTPHGMFGLKTDNSVMMKTLRPLTEDDVFRGSAGWSDKLKHLFDKALDDSGWTAHTGDDRDNVLNYMMDARDWVFTREGLQVNFDEAVGGCYACNPPDIVVSWTDLKPLQGPGALVP